MAERIKLSAKDFCFFCGILLLYQDRVSVGSAVGPSVRPFVLPFLRDAFPQGSDAGEAHQMASFGLVIVNSRETVIN